MRKQRALLQQHSIIAEQWDQCHPPGEPLQRIHSIGIEGGRCSGRHRGEVRGPGEQPVHRIRELSLALVLWRAIEARAESEGRESLGLSELTQQVITLALNLRASQRKCE